MQPRPRWWTLLGALLVDFARFLSMPRILSATGTTNYAAPLDKSSGGSSGGSSGEKRGARNVRKCGDSKSSGGFG